MSADAGTVHQTTLLSRIDTRSRRQRMRGVALAIGSGLLISAAALALVPLGVLTLFRARRVYSFVARTASRLVLRLYGIRVRIMSDVPVPFPATQTIFISNHTSTLDLFLLMALGLPNCRFFLSGFLRKFVPLGIVSSMMGTFFTVPQSRPAERTRIFQRAERILRRTGESVYLSPEGGRITTGAIGHFNKGAFHLATGLRAPIVPFYIAIPPDIDPGMGYDARPGIVDVHVLPSIDTRAWRLEELDLNRERVREIFVRFHAGIVRARTASEGLR